MVAVADTDAVKAAAVADGGVAAEVLRAAAIFEMAGGVSNTSGPLRETTVAKRRQIRAVSESAWRWPHR